jgi:predicted TPR repeat methyltransferase
MSDGFLNKVYNARDAASTRTLYDDWASTYEAEVGANGYVTPGRCAEALAQFMTDKSQPILDFGCGTGLSGLALKLAGFDVLDGQDLSADMLEKAKDKGIYRSLKLVEADGSPPCAPGTYAAIAAIGVIGAGAAPIALFDTLMESLDMGGFLLMSFNDHALEDPENEARLNDWVDRGEAVLRFKEYGPHLPGIDLKSNVYLLEKA